MNDDHEIHRMEGEGFMAHPDDQASEIQRLKAKLDDPGGGVPLMGHEERGVHAILAMATVLRGGLDHLMHGSECAPTLDRLLALMQDILGAIRGTTIIPVGENVALLVAKCEDAILDMQRARGIETNLKDLLTQGERYSKMAESMAANPPAN